MLIESCCRASGKQGLVDREELLPTQLSRRTVVLERNARKFLNVGSQTRQQDNFCYTLVPGGGRFELSDLEGLGFELGFGFWIMFT